MERLTKVYSNGTIGTTNEPLRYYNYDDFIAVLKRLAKIENILGEEYDLNNFAELVKAKQEGKIVDRNDLLGAIKLIADKSAEECWKMIEEETGVSRERLIKLAKADKEGQCVVLPCEIGSKVYVIENGIIEKLYVSEFFNGGDGWKVILKNNKNKYKYREKFILLEDFNKTVFICKLEAEAKLKELKENG